MENKKYLDKIIGSLVRSTNIDYDLEKIYFSFIPSFFSYPSLSIRSSFSLLFSSITFLESFYHYCRDQFGLTWKEVDYVWNEYRSIIKDKISKRES